MSTFEKLQRETVKDFLQSVIIIDDNIEYAEEPNTENKNEAGDSGSGDKTQQSELKNNKDNSSSKQELLSPEDELSNNPNETNDEKHASPNKNIIYANKIIESFSKDGIACVPFRWDPKRHKQNSPPQLSLSADITILDWLIDNGKTDETSLTLLKSVIKNSDHKKSKFFVIYTDKKDVISVIARSPLCEYKEKSQSPEHIDYTRENEEHVSLRITVISKGDTDAISLKDKVIDAFSRFQNGFLPNVALSAIAAIRQHTFDLLSLYPSNLDKAALSHYSSIKANSGNVTAKGDFINHLTDNLQADLRDILDYSDTFNNSVKGIGLSKYIETLSKSYSKSSDYTLNKATLISDDPVTDVSSLVKEALSKNAIKAIENGKFLLEDDTKLLEKYTSLTICHKRIRFSNKNYPLKFGVIVADEASDTYYICIQPVCDSVRLEKSTIFPFIELNNSAPDKDSKFVFYIENNGEVVSLTLGKKPMSKLRTFNFQPDKTSQDIRTDIDHLFTAEGEKIKLKWLAEIRRDYAYPLVQMVSLQAERVGLNKFEWHRHQEKD